MSAITTTTATSTTQVHLTRRGRLALTLALVAVLFAAFSLGRADSQAAPTAPTADAEQVQTLHQVTVAPGESLWAVAERIAPHADPRDVMEQIAELNDLDSTQLQVGQQLLLPAAA